MEASSTYVSTNPLHGMWASVAGSWAEHADYVDARGAPLTEEILELSAPQPGERVLELACGPGGLGLAAAAIVGPTGHVVLSDVVPEMTSIAAARVVALGLGNVTTRELDLDRIEQPDASYDVVLCREGLMFALDPAHAVGDRASAAPWRTRRDRGAGPARAQSLARARVGRGERRARRAGSSTRCPRSVLARGFRKTGRSVRRRRVRRCRRQRVACANARRRVRGVVDEDAVARRATHHDARVTPRRRRSRSLSARRNRHRCLPDAVRSRVSRRQPARHRAASSCMRRWPHAGPDRDVAALPADFDWRREWDLNPR